MFENWQILKTEIEEKADEYSQVAEWCNNSGAYTIIEDGDVYKVVPVVVPEEQQGVEQLPEQSDV